jgi:hypothetical protein
MNPCNRERGGLMYYSYAVYGCGKPHRRLLNPWSTHVLREQAVVAETKSTPSFERLPCRQLSGSIGAGKSNNDDLALDRSDWN